MDRRRLLAMLGALAGASGLPDEVRALTFGDGSLLRSASIELFDDTRIFVPAAVSGREMAGLVDSGAEMSVMDLAAARALGLSLDGGVTALGVGGRIAAHFTEAEVSFAGGPPRRMRLVVIDLAAVGDAIGRPLPLIIGKDLLSEQVVDIDLPMRRLDLHDPELYAPPREALTLRLRSDGPLASVELRIEDHPPEWFDLDTGAGGALAIYPETARRLGLPDDRPRSTTLTGGVGGLLPAPVLTLRTVELGGRIMADVPAVLEAAPPGAPGGSVSGGRVGMGILSRFRVALDLGGGRLHLSSSPGAERLPFWKNRIGLKLVRADAGVSVMHVFPGSPGAAAGWRPGDQVTAVDGVPAADLSLDDLNRIMSSPAGTWVVVSGPRGLTRLQASDFY